MNQTKLAKKLLWSISFSDSQYISPVLPELLSTMKNIYT